MQRRLVILGIFLLVPLSGCIEQPDDDDFVPTTEHQDQLVPEHPVRIEPLEGGGRRYAWDLDAYDQPGGRLYRFGILPLAPVNVSADWAVAHDTTGRQDECSLISLDRGTLGDIDPELPSTGSLQWTRPERIRAEANAGVGVGGAFGTLADPERLETAGALDLAVPTHDEFYVTFGSSRDSERWSMADEARQHQITITVEVDGPSILIAPDRPDLRWFTCGVGTDEIRTEATAGLGPLSATRGGALGFGSPRPEASLVWSHSAQETLGEVTMRFLDETHETPSELVRTARTSGAAAPASITFHEWVEQDGERPLWFLSDSYLPWLERAVFDATRLAPTEVVA